MLLSTLAAGGADSGNATLTIILGVVFFVGLAAVVIAKRRRP